MSQFFEEQYTTILKAQAEMKYFPPGAAVRMWKKNKAFLPHEVDQPLVDRENVSKLNDKFM